MKGSEYLKWIRRLVVLGAAIAAVTASTAGAVRPADDGGPTAQNLPIAVMPPPTVSEAAVLADQSSMVNQTPNGLDGTAVAATPPTVSKAAAPTDRSSAAMPPPSAGDAAALADQGSGSVTPSSGFAWTDWAIGIGTGLGIVLLLGAGFVVSRQMRHHPQPA